MRKKTPLQAVTNRLEKKHEDHCIGRISSEGRGRD